MIGGPTNLIEKLFAATLIGGGALAANAGLKGLQNQRREEGKSGILGGRPGDLSPEQLKDCSNSSRRFHRLAFKTMPT